MVWERKINEIYATHGGWAKTRVKSRGKTINMWKDVRIKMKKWNIKKDVIITHPSQKSIYYYILNSNKGNLSP